MHILFGIARSLRMQTAGVVPKGCAGVYVSSTPNDGLALMVPDPKLENGTSTVDFGFMIDYGDALNNSSSTNTGTPSTSTSTSIGRRVNEVVDGLNDGERTGVEDRGV